MNTPDIEKIATLAARECIRQHVGIDRVAMLLNGYVFTYSCRYSQTFDIDHWLAVGGVVEPSNCGYFRRMPVTFQNGGGAANYASIPDLMDRLTEAINGWFNDCCPDREAFAKDFTKQFLWIHPFSDGNGRTAWLLYNWLSGTLNNPLPLPDFDW